MGIPGLDNILNGGLQPGRLYLIEGSPGAGKTTLALQFLLEGAARGERCLYITLSESQDELETVAQSHGWSLDAIETFELASGGDLNREAEQTILHPSELELGETIQAVIEHVTAAKPDRVAFDSLSEMRLLAQSPLRYRRQVLALKQFFSTMRCTVLLLDDRSSEPGDLPLHSIVHGVVTLEHSTAEYGNDRRRLRVAKMRASTYRSGYHDYAIVRGGLIVYPRLVAAEHHAPFLDERCGTGNAGLDALTGGGLVAGTSVLLIGPAGVGKSTTATSFVAAALRRGEQAAYFMFDEVLGTMLVRSANLGMDLQPYLQSGLLTLRQIDPAEMAPGEFASNVRQAVEQNAAKIVVIDSLNAYLHSMPGEQYMALQMHELLSFLDQMGVITVLILGQRDILSGQMEIDLSYLAGTVISLRYFEVEGAVHKAISVIKTRSSAHENTIRELALGPAGLVIGAPLRGFRGVLSGLPSWDGPAENLLGLSEPA